MTQRARLVSVVCQPQIVADDGTTLAPLQVEPLMVPAGEWPPDLDAVLARIDVELAARNNGAAPVEEPTTTS